MARPAAGRTKYFIAAGAAVALLSASAWLLSGGEEDQEQEAVASPAASSPEAAKAKEPPAPSAPPADAKKDAEPPAPKEPEPEPASTGDKYLQVEESSELPSCEKLLDASKESYAGTANWRSAHNWKLARKSLMVGNQEQAHRYMCEAAFIDQKGPAVAGLAAYYLSRRGLSEAKAWAERGLAANPNSRASRDLLGDTLSQMGKPEEAKEMWLQTLKLTKDDTGRLTRVALTLYKSGRAARKGSDYPLAERLMRRAAAFDPSNALYAAELAGILSHNKQKGLAKLWVERALELDPNSEQARAVADNL